MSFMIDFSRLLSLSYNFSFLGGLYFYFINCILLLFFNICDQTGVALGVEVDDKVPEHEYYGYFGPDYNIHVAPSNMENKSSRKLLDDIRIEVLENLSRLQHVPSVQFHERQPDTELAEVIFSLWHACWQESV